MTPIIQGVFVQSADNFPVAAITAFLRIHWSPQVALAQDDFYQWQMRGQGHDASLVVTDAEGQLLGFLGVTPHNLVIPEGQTVPTCVTTTLVLREDCRGGPLASQLLQSVQDQYQAAFGMNLNATSQSLQRRLGYKVMHAVERMVRVFNADPFLPQLDLTGAGKNLLSLHRQGFRQRVTAVVPYIVPTASQLETQLASYRMNNRYHLCRDWAWYQWRVLKHPVYRYQPCWLYPNEPSRSALVILRAETHPTYSVAHVADCLPLGHDFSAECLPPFLEAWGREHGVDLLDATFTQPQLTAPLWQAGWLSTLHDVDCWLPHLFNPLMLRQPPTGNVAIWGQLPGLLDVSQLHLSKLDADWDRPVYA